MPSSRAVTAVIGIVAVASIAGAVVAHNSTAPDLEVVTPKAPTDERAGLCPWRAPRDDIKRFYPGATGYTTEILVLSRKRLEILRRLGPEATLESNSLYIYPIHRHTVTTGTVLVRRASGRYGAIEIVAALDEARRIAGVRVQRQREPKATADFLTDGGWLASFRGKDVLSPFIIGSDLPPVPEASRESAAAVASAVRSLLIEMDEGTPAGTRHH